MSDKNSDRNSDEDLLYELGLVFSGLYGSRDLSVSKDLIPKLFTIAQAVMDLKSYNDSHPQRYSPRHTPKVILCAPRLEEFFGSFPFREAYDDLCKILKIDYETVREISRSPMGQKYTRIEQRALRDRWEGTWRGSVEVTLIARKVKVTDEVYNPMAEGAIESLTQIADNNPDLNETIKNTIIEYQSRPKKRTEKELEETVEEICSYKLGEDERYDDF